MARVPDLRSLGLKQGHENLDGPSEGRIVYIV